MSVVRGATDSIAPPPATRADGDAIARGDLERTALEHALDAFAAVERDLEVAPVRRDDEAGQPPGVRAAGVRLRQAKSRSVLAAQITSFSVTPPASCVENVTAQRA